MKPQNIEEMKLHVTRINNTGCFVWAYIRWLISACLIYASLACERDVDQELVTEVDEVNITDHEEESDYTWDESGIVTLELNGTSMATNGEGVTIKGSDAVITAAGTYSLSGTLSDGQVTVDTEDEEVVRILFNGVDLHNSSSSPVYIKNAYKTIIVLTDGSNNFVSDASSYSFDSQNEDEPNAAIFSDDNLTIYGNGSLTVDGNYNDGIASKDGLIIKSGTITVNAVDDGIRGKDYLLVKGGNISIDAAGDGLKSDNDEDTAAGFITIEGGTIDISSMEDAITAETDVYI